MSRKLMMNNSMISTDLVSDGLVMYFDCRDGENTFLSEFNMKDRLSNNYLQFKNFQDVGIGNEIFKFENGVFISKDKYNGLILNNIDNIPIKSICIHLETNIVAPTSGNDERYLFDFRKQNYHLAMGFVGFGTSNLNLVDTQNYYENGEKIILTSRTVNAKKNYCIQLPSIINLKIYNLLMGTYSDINPESPNEYRLKTIMIYNRTLTQDEVLKNIEYNNKI